MAVILITGTSKGIGLATALAFGRAGHKVAATMRNPESASQLKNILESESLPITIYSMDVDSNSSVKETVERITAEMGQIDVLINNAGIECIGAVAECTMDNFRAVMETNYFGVIRCVQAVLPQMMKRKTGCIINISSVAGHIASPSMAAYSASKFALESLSEILAQEVKAAGIHVAIVEPGIIDTNMARRIMADPGTSQYGYETRLAALFANSLKNPVPASIVAGKLLEIAESQTWQLRHAVGPDAVPMLRWRRSMSDEEWVDLGALDDDKWYAKMEADFGKDLRFKNLP